MENDFSIDIVTPQIRASFPTVWGVDDPLILDITLSDKKGKSVSNSKLVIDDGEKSTSLVTSEKGELEFTKSYTDLGIKEVKVRYNYAKGPVECIFRVRIVAYRSEVIKLLNEYLERVRKERDFSDKHTVREIIEAIKLRTPKSKHQDLETLVDLFEEAEYSLHPINREYYERFYSAETRSLEVFKF